MVIDLLKVNPPRVARRYGPFPKGETLSLSPRKGVGIVTFLAIDVM